MNEVELEQIRREIEGFLLGRRFGRVFPLSKTSMAIDFHPHNGVYLFIDFDSKARRMYLIRRRLKDLERSSTHSSAFVIQFRKVLSGYELRSVVRRAEGRTLFLDLIKVAGESEPDELKFAVQTGGASSNIFVLDRHSKIIAAARETTYEGQRFGDRYTIPPEEPIGNNSLRELNGGTLSALLDEEDRSKNTAGRFAQLVDAARKTIKDELAKQRRLIKNLNSDLAGHGNADEWKRLGDLILANIATLRREGDNLIVTDFFDPEMSELTVQIKSNQTPAEAAEHYFRRYTKARNGAAAVAERLAIVNVAVAKLEERKVSLDVAIAADDEQAVADFLPAKQSEPVSQKKKDKSDEFKGARRFASTDGYEILVGKKAKDNDYLTFRIAKSFDLWLHAADYPGSHVVVRNPNRKDIPVRTLTEAAELAAFYSDARENPKAAVNYTSKKFVNKPKRSAPGLVSLASFKTILVEPKVPRFLIGTKKP